MDNDELRTTPEIIEKVFLEMRRARRVKAIESYSESAPQMILQLFIILKRLCLSGSVDEQNMLHPTNEGNLNLKLYDIMNILQFFCLNNLNGYIICSKDNLSLIHSNCVCVPPFLVCIGVEKQLQSTGSQHI